jgi:uncharacterized membrane protein YfcA
MVILGYVPLKAVATSQVLQIVAATSGSIENLRQGFIDFRMASVVTIFELLGLIAGARLATSRALSSFGASPARFASSPPG